MVRLTVHYSEDRLQIVRTRLDVQARLDLPSDDPSVTDPNGPTARPVARAAVRYPQGPQGAPSPPSLAETEDDE